jgi:hypothetical protein
MDLEWGHDMNVLTTTSAAEFVRAHGGHLYVWAGSSVCCGGTRFIEASTEPPADLDRFVTVPSAGFELFVRAAGPDELPDELQIDLGGIRRRRVRAYWNGCAYLL